MALHSTARRRWFGALILATAILMLIAGQTFLKGRLQDTKFVVYWLLCFLFTIAAIVIAYIDARAVQRSTRREARDLLQATLNKIERDARNKPGQRTSDEA